MDAAAEAAFREFVVARSRHLLRSAYLMTGDLGEAEDAVQEALSRLYLAWHRVEHQPAVDSYARRILLREVLSRRRRRRVSQVLTWNVPDRPSPDGTADVVIRDEVHRALLRLPARQRAVLVLRFYDDLSEQRTAEVLGISAGSVKQHTARGMARLRELLVPVKEQREC